MLYKKASFYIKCLKQTFLLAMYVYLHETQDTFTILMYGIDKQILCKRRFFLPRFD